MIWSQPRINIFGVKVHNTGLNFPYRHEKSAATWSSPAAASLTSRLHSTPPLCVFHSASFYGEWEGMCRSEDIYMRTQKSFSSVYRSLTLLSWPSQELWEGECDGEAGKPANEEKLFPQAFRPFNRSACCITSRISRSLLSIDGVLTVLTYILRIPQVATGVCTVGALRFGRY